MGANTPARTQSWPMAGLFKSNCYVWGQKHSERQTHVYFNVSVHKRQLIRYSCNVRAMPHATPLNFHSCNVRAIPHATPLNFPNL